jgi:hypothetical protein
MSAAQHVQMFGEPLSPPALQEERLRFISTMSVWVVRYLRTSATLSLLDLVGELRKQYVNLRVCGVQPLAGASGPIPNTQSFCLRLGARSAMFDPMIRRRWSLLKDILADTVLLTIWLILNWALAWITDLFDKGQELEWQVARQLLGCLG